MDKVAIPNVVSVSNKRDIEQTNDKHLVPELNWSATG